MAYPPQTRKRIAAYRKEDETVTTEMIEAGINAMRRSIGTDGRNIVLSVYESMRASRPKYAATDIARFWQKVQKQPGDNACWIWIGAKKTRSKTKSAWRAPLYGKIIFQGKDLAAHIMSYEIHNGAVPAGMLVCHSCDNPSCVNPGHLWLGDHNSNASDMWAKGRARPNGLDARGSRNTQSILTESDIPKIRRWISQGVSQTEVAAQFGVTIQCINRIHRGVAWTHVP